MPISGADSLPRQLGDYVLMEALGVGGSGSAFLARSISRSDKRPFVVKRLHPMLVDSEQLVRRFRHEARIAVAVDSPHVARVYDAGVVGDEYFIAMEWIEGWTFAAMVAALKENQRALASAAVVALGREGLAGLAALHDAYDPETLEPLGIVHRDLSPRNVMLAEEGRVVIIDLGLGKSNVQDWRTRTGHMMGSLGYMSPEQVSGERIDHRSDLFTFALVLYEVLTGHPYIPRTGTRPELLRRMLAPEWVPPSRYRADVDPSLDRVFARALAVDPDARFESAAAFSEALASARAEEGEPAVVVVRSLLSATLVEERARVTTLMGTAVEEARTALDVEGDQASTRVVTSASRRPLLAFAAVATVVVVLFVASMIGVRSSAPTPIRIEPTADPPRVAPGVTPGVTTRAPPPTTEEIPDAGTAIAAPARTERRKAPRPIPVEEERVVPVIERVARITAKAQRVRRRSPAEAARIDRIVSDASLWSTSADTPRARAALDRLEAELDALAP